ncbi:MAG: hypothetical protein C5B50_24240 [Verrucomicrobia bacterium]|nr:MAG: hypothetical protein C5B50_24240 [Verrucomicrobiota bacterium]
MIRNETGANYDLQFSIYASSAIFIRRWVVRVSNSPKRKRGNAAHSAALDWRLWERARTVAVHHRQRFSGR